MWRRALHTAKIKLCVYGVRPSPVYEGVEEGADRPPRALPQGGNPTPTRSRDPPFPGPNRRGKEGREGRKERGAGPPPNSDWAWVGAPLGLLLSLPLKPM